MCLVTSNMTLTRAKIDVNIPRKRKGNCSQHDKGLAKFYEAILQAILRHINFDIVKCFLIASPGFVKVRTISNPSLFFFFFLRLLLPPTPPPSYSSSSLLLLLFPPHLSFPLYITLSPLLPFPPPSYSRRPRISTRGFVRPSRWSVGRSVSRFLNRGN